MSALSPFAKVIADVRKDVAADGIVDFGETARLLRISRTYAEHGSVAAQRLVELLEAVRADGRITAEESRQVLDALDGIAGGSLRLADYVKAIPDFPKPGVMFRDVTGILESLEGLRLAVDLMEESLCGVRVDLVAAPESRGFIFGAALADRLGAAFAPVRKPGKLPRETISEKYDLEYGQAELHLHKDAIIPDERVVIVDDLLATGGTAAAGARLVERLGGKVVKMIFPIELEGFGARTGLLRNYDVVSLLKYPGK